MLRFIITLGLGLLFLFGGGCYTVPPQEQKKGPVVIEEHQEIQKSEWKETLGD